MKALGVIPARLYSSRFPKKILHQIDGKPMVVHVYENAKKAKLIEDLIIAIDNVETENVLKKWKVKSVMTSNSHFSGTDRIHEVAKSIDSDIVINIQADEPEIDPNIIDRLIDEFEENSVKIATVAGKYLDPKKLYDKNTVKVLLDSKGFAVNFRRTPIEFESAGYYHHMGIYAYRKKILEKFTDLSPSKNEMKFNLEQYRALDNNIPIKVVLIDKVSKGIDTMDDLKELGKF